MLTQFERRDVADLMVELSNVTLKREWSAEDPEDLIQEFRDFLLGIAYEYDHGVFERHPER